tara:strand:+ start:185 stop:400 length:216 start_codon:yes stop_codon:yes gene_type:complete
LVRSYPTESKYLNNSYAFDTREGIKALEKRASAVLQELCVVKQTGMIIVIRKDKNKTISNPVTGKDSNLFE